MVSMSLIPEALHALRSHPLRSGLTILGMVFGVMSVIAIVSVVEGMQEDIESTLESMGPNTFTVTRFGFDLTWAQYVERAKRKILTRELIPLMEEGCEDCAQVGATTYVRETIKYGKHRVRRAEINGETPNVLSMRDYDVLFGRYLSWEDEYRRRQVIFLGYGAYEKLFPGEDPVGKKVMVGQREFTIIGVAEERDGSMVSGLDNESAIPLATHQKIYGRRSKAVNLLFMAQSMEARQRAVDQVRVVLRSARRIPYGDQDDFTVMTPEAILEFVNDVTRAYRVIMIALPLLSIVIGGIVIMNIMMISVTERTREIGIRKSLGARRRHILMQFLYESLILSLIGGLLGIFFGVKVGAVILTSLMNIYVNPTALAIILGAGISIGVGLFFGMYPARKAAKFDPIKALSYE